MNQQRLIEFLTRNGWTRSLPIEVVDELVSISKVRELDKGQRLHAKNDPPEGFYCVLDGKMRISNVNSQGKEMVLTWLEAGSWFGEISLLDGLPRTHDAHAQTHTRLLVIPNLAFAQLMQRQPLMYPAFLKLLCQRIRATFSLIDETGGLSLLGQLSKRLLILADGLNIDDSVQRSQEIAISQESLAHMLNSSRQTVNKLLSQLKNDHIIRVEYGKIEILDRQKLAKLGEV